MDPLLLLAAWLLLGVLPAVILTAARAGARWIFLTLLLGPAGLAGFALSRLAPGASRHP